MADRKLIVQIVGDDRSLQAAFARSTASTARFSSTVKRSLSGGVSVQDSFGPLLARTREMRGEADALGQKLEDVGGSAGGAGAGLGVLALRAGAATFAINAAYQGSRHLRDALEETGTEAFTTGGKLRNLAASLLSGDVVGGLQALEAQPKTLEELGISAVEASNRMAALSTVVHADVDALREQAGASKEGEAAWNAYRQAVDEAGTGNKRLAQELINQVAAMQAAENAQDALADSTARLGTVFRDATGQAVTFKGAVDDLGGPRGPGAVDQINANLEANRFPNFPTPPKPIGPADRRAGLEQLAQAQGDLPELLRLQKIDEARLRVALANSRGNKDQRTKLNQELASASAAVIGTQKAIAAAADASAKAAAAAAKAAAEAGRQARAKAIERFLGSLGLDVDRARLTNRLDDDLRALNALAAGLRAQIAKGGDVARFQQQLVGVVGQIAQTNEEIRTRAEDAVQAQQFRSIGLSAEGGDIIPGIANLRKQFEQLSENVVGQDVPRKMLDRLKVIGKTLSRGIKDATPETLRAINDFFKDVRGAFDTESEKGVVPPRHVRLSDQILTALGFGRDSDVARLNRLGDATRTLTASSGAAARTTIGQTAAAGGVTITGPITVVADNPDAFLRELQKTAGRTTATASGRFPGRSLGLG